MDGWLAVPNPQCMWRYALPSQRAEVMNLSSMLVSWFSLPSMACGPFDCGGIAGRARQSPDSKAADAVCHDAPPANPLALLLDAPADPNAIVVKPELASQGDKFGLTLLDPTPRSLTRNFNTDRPDVTESPYTVDAGHVQAEFTLVEYTYDHGYGERTNGFSVLQANRKIGLLNNLDLQLVLNPYRNILTFGPSLSHRDSGFGDAELRVKLNLWGNDGEKTSSRVMPFVPFPAG